MTLNYRSGRRLPTTSARPQPVSAAVRAVRTVLSALQDRGLTLPLDTLKALVEASDSKARIGAL
jgi:hypothetical protein